jgi:hypothetical protein
MKLGWSTCARNRQWSKAMRRIRPRFDSLIAAFDALRLNHPDYEAILVGVTDDHPAEYLKEVPNADRFYQAIVGFDPLIGLGAENDQMLAAALFRQLSRAILTCSFAATDREAVCDMLQAWAGSHLASGGSADTEPGAAPDRRRM